MKLAIVHDYLCGVGGSERVFQYICEEFPDADAYTLAYNPETTLPFFKNRNIKTTKLNRIVQSMDAFRWSWPVCLQPPIERIRARLVRLGVPERQRAAWPLIRAGRQSAA